MNMENDEIFPTEAYTPEISETDMRIEPHSREAEEAVLGAVLINSEKYFDVAQVISSDDFYIHRHQWIWQAYASLIEQGRDIDVQTISDELDKKGRLSESGGWMYLYSLVSKTPSSMHAESYAHIILEKSVRRRLLAAASHMTDLAFDEKKKLDEVLDQSEKAIFNISEKQDRKEVQPINKVLSEIFDNVKELYQKDQDIVGIPTGFKDLDRLLGGLQNSDLIIVAGSTLR